MTLPQQLMKIDLPEMGPLTGVIGKRGIDWCLSCHLVCLSCVCINCCSTCKTDQGGGFLSLYSDL